MSQSPKKPDLKNTRKHLKNAVHKHDALSKRGILERLFTMAFKGLVYPQIWEDPVVDLVALQIKPDSHVVTIASGGCNVLSYLVADPRRVTAIDLNRAHIALTRLKLLAARHLPDYECFFRFFGDANDGQNIAAYDQHLREKLDSETRTDWEGRNLSGRRRVALFDRNFYHYGQLGKFIGAGHFVARLYGRNPRDMLRANSIEEQKTIFDDVIAPLFNKPFVRWALNRPMSLYGLGIPPAQYEALAVTVDNNIANVVRERLERLACGFCLEENYSARKAFGRHYRHSGPGSVPPYLQGENYFVIRERVARVIVYHKSYTEFLESQPDQSVDRYALLDAQDWMTDAELTSLWREITRTAKPGARVIFRTAAKERLLPGRVPDEILDHWEYDAESSEDLTERDRSSVYGGFHLYILPDHAVT